MPQGAGPLRERVAIDRKTEAADDLGGLSVNWSEIYSCWAEFRYRRGGEQVEAGGLAGQAMFKVRLRANAQSIGITQGDRLRDVRRAVAYNIREVDAVSDRAHVWLVVESGVAI